MCKAKDEKYVFCFMYQNGGFMEINVTIQQRNRKCVIEMANHDAFNETRIIVWKPITTGN